MTTLHIEHDVLDFDNWKKVFDSDPAERQKSGVRSYKLARQADDPKHVILDLDFDTKDTAQAFLGKLKKVWEMPQAKATLASRPEARVLDSVETKQL